MFHIVAFQKSHDPGGAYANLDAVVDSQIKTSGVFAAVPNKLPLLIGAAALVGTAGSRARVISPSIKQVNPQMIAPVTKLLVPPAVVGEWMRPANAFQLDGNENLSVEENSNPAAAEVHTAILALADSIPQPVAGQITTVRATITLAQVVGQWSLSEITLIDDLKTGTYALVGARANIAGGTAFRFAPVGEVHRPGGLCAQDEDDLDVWYQRNGALGVWFEFETTQLPAVEVLGSAAAGSATYDIFLDVIRA